MGLGVVSWDAPTTDGIWDYASLLADSSSIFKEYIANDAVSFAHYFQNQIDVGTWTVGDKTLVLATNLNYVPARFDLSGVRGLVAHQGAVQQVLDSGARLSGRVIDLESVGTGGFILGR